MDRDKITRYGKEISQITLGELFHVLVKRFYQLLQITPLVLLYFLSNSESVSSSEMANEFIVSSFFALLIIIISYLVQGVIDRLVLSINTYILIGGIAYLLQIYPVIRLIVYLQNSGIFVASVLIGFITILFSPYGFIGVKNARRMIIYLYSFNLLSISVLMLTVSLHFQDSKFFGFFLPFICLYICNYWFKGVLVGKY